LAKRTVNLGHTDYNTGMLDVVLEVRELRVLRGERAVLKKINLRLGAGQYLELRGANGSGKTSLLRAVAGLLPIDAGGVFWRSAPLATDRSAFRSESLYLGHDAPLKADFSAIENLHYWIGLRRPLQRQEIEAALAKVGLPATAQLRPTRQLSAGQRRRVSLAALLLARVRLWLLDEPTTQLDSDGQAMFAGLVEEHLRGGGIAVAAMHAPLAPAPAAKQELVLAAA
jgi:heme exporter protein A